MKLVNSTNLSEEIFTYSKSLFNNLCNREPIRLIGLRVTDFSSNNDIQLSLFDENNKVIKDKEIDKLVDIINKKFGNETIKKGIK